MYGRSTDNPITLALTLCSYTGCYSLEKIGKCSSNGECRTHFTTETLEENFHMDIPPLTGGEKRTDRKGMSGPFPFKLSPIMSWMLLTEEDHVILLDSSDLMFLCCLSHTWLEALTIALVWERNLDCWPLCPSCNRTEGCVASLWWSALLPKLGRSPVLCQSNR